MERRENGGRGNRREGDRVQTGREKCPLLISNPFLYLFRNETPLTKVRARARGENCAETLWFQLLPQAALWSRVEAKVFHAASIMRKPFLLPDIMLCSSRPLARLLFLESDPCVNAKDVKKQRENQDQKRGAGCLEAYCKALYRRCKKLQQGIH